MSALRDMVASHCPDGVEFKPLGAVVKIRNGRTYQGLGSGTVPVYGSGGVMTHVDQAIGNGPSVLVPRKGSLGNLFYVEGPFWNVDTIFRTECSAEILPRFLYYHLGRARLADLNTAGGVPSLTQGVLNQLKVPVPPLVVQRGIVSVLDAMQRLVDELEAELEARRKQYTHYLQVLVGRIDAKMTPLSDLGSWVGGMTPPKDNPEFWESGTIPWLASRDIGSAGFRGRVTEKALKQTSLRLVPAPAIAVVMRSNILRRRLPVRMLDFQTTLNQDVRALIPTAGVDAEFVYHVLRAESEQIRRRWVRTDGSMAALDSRGFLGWQVPLPALEEQRHIASRFRVFDQLVSDHFSGLPAEIAARRKQYEHYRDLLMTFLEKLS